MDPDPEVPLLVIPLNPDVDRLSKSGGELGCGSLASASVAESTASILPSVCGERVEMVSSEERRDVKCRRERTEGCSTLVSGVQQATHKGQTYL